MAVTLLFSKAVIVESRLSVRIALIYFPIEICAERPVSDCLNGICKKTGFSLVAYVKCQIQGSPSFNKDIHFFITDSCVLYFPGR
jgi:hypothetical protein